MEVRIKEGNGYVDADWTIEDGVMVVSPKELKFEPKDGDVLKADGSICIFKEERCSVKPSFSSYTLLCNGTIHHNMPVLYTTRSYATEEEKQKLFDKLAEEGLAWDAERKELVKLKWKPKDNELYCRSGFNNEEFACYKDRWDNTKYENFLYNKGWIFKTEQECQEFCDKLNEAINQVKPIINNHERKNN